MDVVDDLSRTEFDNQLDDLGLGDLLVNDQSIARNCIGYVFLLVDFKQLHANRLRLYVRNIFLSFLLLTIKRLASSLFLDRLCFLKIIRGLRVYAN